MTDVSVVVVVRAVWKLIVRLHRKARFGTAELSAFHWFYLTGEVYLGKVATAEASLDKDFKAIMELAEKHTRMYVRTNADTPHDAQVARDFGARGVGLCRTEHMFFEGDRIDAMREMILSDTVEERRIALAKILPMQRSDFEGILEAMDGFGVTIRLLDPPLHEFTPNEPESQKYMAEKMGISVEVVKEKVDALHEFNPMLGHRGCRLGILIRLNKMLTGFAWLSKQREVFRSWFLPYNLP